MLCKCANRMERVLGGDPMNDVYGNQVCQPGIVYVCHTCRRVAIEIFADVFWLKPDKE